MICVLKNAEVYTPEKIGVTDVTFDGEYTIKVGKVDDRALAQSKLEMEVVDLTGKILIPGIIDPHVHLLGGSGESGGFSSQTPEVSLTELTMAGTTTVVGTLGADTNMKTMAGLLAKVKGLHEEKMSAYLWTGGYRVPPQTVMPTLTEDIMFLSEVIGTGEVAIADERSDEPDSKELMRVLSQTHLAGNLAKKCGRTHFHVGSGKQRLKLLFEIAENSSEVFCEWMYPTHINRNKELLEDGIKLAKKGAFVDMDTVDEDLTKWLPFYLDGGGPKDQLTISSDAAKTSPSNLFEQLRTCVLHHGFLLEEILPFVTTNTAKALKLEEHGSVAQKRKADFVVLDSDLNIVHVISRGEFQVKHGKFFRREKFLEGSNRNVHLVGSKVRKS